MFPFPSPTPLRLAALVILLASWMLLDSERLLERSPANYEGTTIGTVVWLPPDSSAATDSVTTLPVWSVRYRVGESIYTSRDWYFHPYSRESEPPPSPASIPDGFHPRVEIHYDLHAPSRSFVEPGRPRPIGDFLGIWVILVLLLTVLVGVPWWLMSRVLGWIRTRARSPRSAGNSTSMASSWDPSAGVAEYPQTSATSPRSRPRLRIRCIPRFFLWDQTFVVVLDKVRVGAGSLCHGLDLEVPLADGSHELILDTLWFPDDEVDESWILFQHRFESAGEDIDLELYCSLLWSREYSLGSFTRDTFAPPAA